MRTLFTLLFLCLAPLAHAIPVDVGTPGTYFEKRGLVLPAFNGIPLQGKRFPLTSFSATALRSYQGSTTGILTWAFPSRQTRKT